MARTGPVGGYLKDINPQSNRVYNRMPFPPNRPESEKNTNRDFAVDPGLTGFDPWTIEGRYGVFRLEATCAIKDSQGNAKGGTTTNPTFNVFYEMKTTKVSGVETPVKKGKFAFLRFVRSGHNFGWDTDDTTQFPEPALRTESYAGYRVDRPSHRTPFARQADPPDPFALDGNRFIDTSSDITQLTASDSDSPELLLRMIDKRRTTALGFESLFFRFEGIDVLMNLSTGEMLDIIEWGGHVERDSVNTLLGNKQVINIGTLTLYAPTLLFDTLQSEDADLKRAAQERFLGMKLAMGLWNHDYSLLVKTMSTEPRFRHLREAPRLGFTGSWHRQQKWISPIPGERTQWDVPEDLLRRYMPPSDIPPAVSPAERPLAVDPLPAPQVPPDPAEELETMYTFNVHNVSKYLITRAEDARRLHLSSREPRTLISPKDAIWLSAQYALTRRAEKQAEKEKSQKPKVKFTDWEVMSEVLEAVREKFEVAAMAARRPLNPPPSGYLQRGHDWLRDKYGLEIETVDTEDAVLTAVDTEALIINLLRDMDASSDNDIGISLAAGGVQEIIKVCDALWQVYTIECGHKDKTKKYNTTFLDHTPKWFRHLQSDTHHFYSASRKMLDAFEAVDGSLTDPLPGPELGGFARTTIGFVVDGRSKEAIREARGIVSPLSYNPPSFKMSKEKREDAERIHPNWAHGTLVAGGNAFFRRDTYEFDYQTAVIATRSPAGTFRFLGETGYLYAVHVPNYGIDLEAAQRYMAAITGERSKIARVGEKAYPSIPYEDFLASIQVETARQGSHYPSFYRYVGNWEYITKDGSTKAYIASALSPALMPIPLCCYSKFAQNLRMVRFKGSMIDLGAIVATPVHVWKDLTASDQRANLDTNEQEQLNKNELLSVAKDSVLEQVQDNPILLAEYQRKTFLEFVEKTVKPDVLSNYQYLTQYPEWFLDSAVTAFLEEKLTANSEEYKNKTEQVWKQELNLEWESACGPRVRLAAFDIQPDLPLSFRNSLHVLDLSEIEKLYFTRVGNMYDPDAEEWHTVDENGTEVRWPVSPQPKGFTSTKIAFFVAHPYDFGKNLEDSKDIRLFPEFSPQGRLSAVWNDLNIQGRDFIFNYRETSLIPESCIFVSRTFEGAVMTAKPNIDLTYNLETAARVYAVRLSDNTVGFDLERFQLDEISVPVNELGSSDVMPGIKALGMKSSLKASDIIGWIPIQRVDQDVPESFETVISFASSISKPKKLQTLFHVRLLSGSWTFADNAGAADKAYLERAIPEVWLGSVPEVDGRVRSESYVDIVERADNYLNPVNDIEEEEEEASVNSFDSTGL